MGALAHWVARKLLKITSVMQEEQVLKEMRSCKFNSRPHRTYSRLHSGSSRGTLPNTTSSCPEGGSELITPKLVLCDRKGPEKLSQLGHDYKTQYPHYP